MEGIPTDEFTELHILLRKKTFWGITTKANRVEIDVLIKGTILASFWRQNTIHQSGAKEEQE